MNNISSIAPARPASIKYWRVVQIVVWLLGAGIYFSLIFFPDTGIHLFWNVLIPIAPALLVVAVGVWRNICPLGATSLLPRHLGLSKRKRLTASQTGKLNMVGIILLYVIVPLRHGIFDKNGLATAILITVLIILAVTLGFFFEWKSAWCAGICPIHPVEKLYGQNNMLTTINAHCPACSRCTIPCPDTTPGIYPFSVNKTYYKITGILTVAALPGFIWGWFQVPDQEGITNMAQLLFLYIPPMVGMSISSFIFLILAKFWPKNTLSTIFAVLSVSFYYWFRIPALIGYGVYPGDGMIIDLSQTIFEWQIRASTILFSLFFFWWIVLRKNNKRSWKIRPSYSN